MTDEVLAEGEAALDQILNKVSFLSYIYIYSICNVVFSFRLKSLKFNALDSSNGIERIWLQSLQLHKRKKCVADADDLEGEGSQLTDLLQETKEGKDFEIPKLTPEEEEIVQKIEAQKRQRLSIFDGAEKWVRCSFSCWLLFVCCCWLLFVCCLLLFVVCLLLFLSPYSLLLCCLGYGALAKGKDSEGREATTTRNKSRNDSSRTLPGAHSSRCCCFIHPPSISLLRCSAMRSPLAGKRKSKRLK